jgi:hypothetical protein
MIARPKNGHLPFAFIPNDLRRSSRFSFRLSRCVREGSNTRSLSALKHADARSSQQPIDVRPLNGLLLALAPQLEA